MRLSVVISLLAVCSVLALPLAQTESDALSLSSRSEDCDSKSVFCAGKKVPGKRRRPKSAAAKARTAAKSAAKKAAKPERAKTKKAAGLTTKSSKSPTQVKTDRKARRDTQKSAKAAKAAAATAKPGYKSHEQKIKDSKAKVTFSPGAAKRLDSMGLHGKNRKAAKKYHKDVMKSEMKKNGAVKGNVVATAHKGGTVKDEKNHLTAQFKDSKGRNIPSSWVDKKTGATKTGEKDQHHVYPSDKKKVPSGWSKAVAASDAKKAEAEAADKAAEDAAAKAKLMAAKAAGEATKSTISDADKAAQRKAKNEERKARKVAPITKKVS